MCVRIREKEPNQRKTILAYKIFSKHHRSDESIKGLFPQFRPAKKGAVVGKWLKSTRYGWHAYLSLRAAQRDSYLEDYVIKRVKLRQIIGYGTNAWTTNRNNVVRAREMFIL
jgi:hypothetical protein